MSARLISNTGRDALSNSHTGTGSLSPVKNSDGKLWGAQRRRAI